MKTVDLIPMILVIGVFLIILFYLIAQSYDIRKLIGKITSPLFVPLRKLVVWGDKNFGTCDMKLTMAPRWEHPLNGFADIDEGVGEQE